MFTYQNRYIPYINVACIVVEGFGVFLSLMTAYAILNWKMGSNIIEFQDAVVRGISITISALFCLYLLDFYDMRISFSPLEILFSVIFTTGFIFITIGVFSFIVPELGVGGVIYYLTGLIVFLFLMFWRISLQIYLNNYTPLNNVLIIGGGAIAFELAELIVNSRRLGFHLVGMASQEKIRAPKNPVGRIPTWSIEDVKSIIDKNRINKIIVTEGERRG